MNRLVFAIDDLTAELAQLGVPRAAGASAGRLVLEGPLYEAAKRDIENRAGHKWPEGHELRIGGIVLCRG